MPTKLSLLPDAIFIGFVNKASTLRDVAQLCGYSFTSGGSIATISKRINQLGLSTSHFNNWNAKASVPTSALLVYGSARDNQTIKKRMIKESILPYCCSDCGNTGIHNGKSLVLHLDHTDGDPKNNVLSNLRFLCPNCHSQTHTYGGKNNKGVKRKM